MIAFLFLIKIVSSQVLGSKSLAKPEASYTFTRTIQQLEFFEQNLLSNGDFHVKCSPYLAEPLFVLYCDDGEMAVTNMWRIVEPMQDDD